MLAIRNWIRTGLVQSRSLQGIVISLSKMSGRSDSFGYYLRTYDVMVNSNY